MRPRGEIRQALSQAAHALAEQQGGATWREIASAACVGFDAARRTIENMARAGELQACGTARVQQSRRPMVKYAPRAANFAIATTGALDVVMRAWR